MFARLIFVEKPFFVVRQVDFICHSLIKHNKEIENPEEMDPNPIATFFKIIELLTQFQCQLSLVKPCL